MNRKEFLTKTGIVMGGVLTLRELDAWISEHPGQRMPSLFVSHGSPMNALADNPYTRDLKATGQRLPAPKALLVVSAHWLTRGTFVATHPQPETIHDFGGFPKPLFDIQYPAPGAQDLARALAADSGGLVKEDPSWGLDHGAWTVLLHMFPEAKIPVFQLSIDYYKPLSYHLELAALLKKWREKGVMMLSSGNVTHNLGVFDRNESAPVADWAREFDELIKNAVEQGNLNALAKPEQWGNITKLAHPSYDHYIPLLYASGLEQPGDQLQYIHQGFQHGTLSMRSYMFSKA